MSRRFQVEVEREDDGRWIADIAALPGVMSYGSSCEEAIAKTEALALRVLAEHIEHGEEIVTAPLEFSFIPS